MNIIIIGGGSVGAALCAQLVKEGHDITVVDRDIAAVTEISNLSDVAGVVGNGADVSVLRKAGAARADLAIAVTTDDEVNILTCAAAKKLGAKHTIARVRNPEYSELIGLMKSELNLSMTLNPEYAAAKEIFRILRYPSAAKLDTFCRGRVELAQFVVPEDSPLSGHTLNEIRPKMNRHFLVCCVMRDNAAVIPDGNFELRCGDVICVTVAEDDITPFFKEAGVYKEPVKDVLIFGGGRITYYLEQFLQRSKIGSTVIEKDKELCRDLAEQYSCTVVCDNGTNQDLLLEEGIDRTDAFIALSPVDEENAIVSMYAKTVGVKKIVTLISRMQYIDFFKSVGLESIVSPKSSMAALTLRYVRALANTRDAEIESLHRIMEDKVEALEFVIKDDVDGLTGIPLKDLKTKHGLLIACILHKEKVVIPSGGDTIEKGDTVIVVTVDDKIDNIKDILR